MSSYVSVLCHLMQSSESTGALPSVTPKLI